MNANKFSSCPISTILKRVCQNIKLFLSKPHNPIFVRFGIPIAIFILYATAQSMPVMRKAGINGCRRKKICYRREARW